MKSAVAWLFLLLIQLTVTTQAASNPISSRFNFSYAIEGESAIAPSQIFDDGHQLFLQFNHLSELPKIYLDDGKGMAQTQEAASQLRSPYLVLSNTPARLHLSLGKLHAVVINQTLKQPKLNASLTQTLAAIFAQRDSSLLSEQKNGPNQQINRIVGNESQTTLPNETMPSASTLLKTNGSLPNGTLIFQAHHQARLSQLVHDFLEGQGFRLQWNSPDDFLIHDAYVIYGNSIPHVMSSVLSEYHLVAKLDANTVTVSSFLP